jgi:hypothetical protein
MDEEMEYYEGEGSISSNMACFWVSHMPQSIMRGRYLWEDMEGEEN